MKMVCGYSKNYILGKEAGENFQLKEQRSFLLLFVSFFPKYKFLCFLLIIGITKTVQAEWHEGEMEENPENGQRNLLF